MDEFIQILNFFRTCIIGLMSVSIPLSPSLSIYWGQWVLGLLAFPVIMKILARLFSGDGALVADQAGKD